MKAEDLAELSSEALLIVRYARVAHANSAAKALFASCGFAGELVGQRLDALWEEGSDPKDATGGRRVRTRGTPIPISLEVRAGAAQPDDESGAFGVRVVRAQMAADAVSRQALLDTVINEAPFAIEIVDPERMRWLIINRARDVTERVHAQEELKLRMEDLARSNRDLEQFAYVTSHDLSEPLRMIASYTELLERRYKTRSSMKKPASS